MWAVMFFSGRAPMTNAHATMQKSMATNLSISMAAVG